MSAFDSQTEEVQRKLAELRIIPGTIAHITCNFTNPPKPKFLVVIYIDEKLGFYLINTAINQYIQNRPELLKLQKQILKTKYSFLDHDSFIDCTKCNEEISKEDLITEIVNDQSCIKGQIDKQDKDDIIRLITASKVYSQEEREYIKTNLSK